MGIDMLGVINLVTMGNLRTQYRMERKDIIRDTGLMPVTVEGDFEGWAGVSMRGLNGNGKVQ